MGHRSEALPARDATRYIGAILASFMLAACAAPAVGQAPAPTPTPIEVASVRGQPIPAPPIAAVTTAPTPLPPTQRPTALPTLAPLPTAPLPTTPPSPTPLGSAMRREIFEQVWQTVRDNYLYPDFHGADWQALHDSYSARIDEAVGDEAFYTLMTEMVNQLGDDHSRFVPPSQVVSEDAFSNGHESYAGIGVVTLPGLDGAFIQMVFPDTPAARADIRPRDRIIAVNSRPYQVEDGDLQGDAGTAVRLSVLRPGERPRDVVLVRQDIQGRIVPTYRRFPGDIGYVWISTLWVNDMDEQVSGALTELVAAGRLNGLIIDLRGNRGGWGHVMDGILSHFMRGQVGSFFSRKGVRPLVISAPAGPDLRSMAGHIVVLIDHDTASYAEVIAATLQREAQAKVVGVPSAGNTETIYAHTLADGSRLWLAQEGFHLPDGTNLEGAGVQPDSTVDLDWKRFSEDDDPQLLEALRLLGAGPK